VQSSTGAPFPFGWKSSADTYNDAAVWAIPGPFPPPTAWTPIRNPFGNPDRYDLAFKITTATNTPPPQGCVETNGTKYVQWPNLNGGLDVWDSGPWVLGDDFVCTNTGPITDLHLWGSWINDRVDPNTTFWLGLYEDVPAGPLGPSHPGNLKWEQTFGPGQYSQSLWGTGQEAFFDPGIPGITGPDSQVWYYCFYPTNPPVQQGTVTQPKVYWLLAYAQPSTLNGYQYGWKTTTNVQQDTSVFAPWAGGPPPAATPWIPIHTASGVPLDLAFKITTATNTPPPQGCVETNGTKYVQWPNLFNGYDVWNSSAFPPNVTDGPWVLADDFVCTNTGPVTDIHIWGSWWYDQVASNSITFWLGIYEDVPTNAANTFSHPGNLIWQQWFAPGQYAETFWDFGQETFLDPGPPQIVGTDTKVWYYCFYPTNPPTQYGSVTAPKTYWVAAYAQLPAGANNQYYGWKTTTNVQHDVSVHARWPGVPPGGNPGWLPTYYPTSVPLDLAFKITTDTNRCPILVTCSLDKTVECGSIWGFDPPIVGPDPCCPSPPVVTFSVVTNLLGPCKEISTGTWTITDCLGTMVTCTQMVTVVDTTPPTITCATNKTVECGTAWTFDSPTATDACCGTNVSISTVGTVTNTPNSCTQIVTRTWRATDCCANSSSCSQTVTVVDTTPPTITCPSNIVVFTCGTNIIVTWTNVASDACSSVTVTSSPPSGSTFLPNTTNTVVATARDACGNSNSCTFTVTVLRPVLGSISIAYVSTNAVMLTWTNGILQVSTNVIGPYGDVPGATPPYTNIPSLLPMKFYRLRCASP